ncbi:MAG: PP2C family protein-serine/threonine phosphatase [Terracidiphilus sp.]
MSEVRNSGQPVILFAEECVCGALCEDNQCSVLHAGIPLGDLLIVASSIGANSEGAAAAQGVVEQFHAHLAGLPSDFPAEQAIREASAQANERLLRTSESSTAAGAPMCSTVVLALLQRDDGGIRAWIGHIGHSRAYLVRANRLHQLTDDHSAVRALLNQGILSMEEAPGHPDALVATRCLGRFPKTEIEIDHLPLASDDTLLLCSEGLWASVPEQKIQGAIASAGVTLEAIAHHLLGLALAMGSPTSIGIEMARLIPPPESAPSRNEPGRSIPRWILAVFLLAFVGLGMLAGVLAYLALWRN